ncbi:MAG: hypothetical protein WCV79_00510 [Candidatus Paceibacterota bacterium]
MKKTTTIITVLILILALVGAAYWYFIFGFGSAPVTALPGNQTTPGGFEPIDRPLPTESTLPGDMTNSSSTTTTTNEPSPLATLRHLSSVPVGGFGVFTSASLRSGQAGSTTIRWVDRGRGNTYEAYSHKPDINILSNTLVPRIYQSWWNNSLNSFFAQYSSATNDTVTTVVANIQKTVANTPRPQNASSTNISNSSTETITETPYQLKGTLVSGNIIDIAVSPAKDRAVVVTKENNRAIGYLSKFDGTGQTQLFSLPLTAITVDWPETNTISVVTKGSASYAGYLYFINTKTGVMKQILGGIAGLSAKVSKDATRVLYSSTGRGESAIETNMLDVKTSTVTDVIFKTLADKCTWSPKTLEQVYCAVPSTLPNGLYPDDWYLGFAAFRDNIWLLDTKTGNGKQIANLLTLGNSLIDAINLEIDNSDNYLVFMNKIDLSLWSLDLAATN